jgi:hypothetical protein
MESPSPLFGLVLAPTRELAYQISQQFEALGSVIGVRSATIVGGMDMVAQSIALSKKPHVRSLLYSHGPGAASCRLTPFEPQAESRETASTLNREHLLIRGAILDNRCYSRATA